ncbi:hypothetical protein KC909_01780 [Candidatus Dojkabacteria bacterium]|uniref:Tetratricopeptide repeat protein n=1 Tax=Candidatus Dojkabacteria bacterium TaxID=2099670 RepID=A0A955L5I7_9BACT|nr:hypothetical protein [Candidatus Dojkabacteria bacterium]
MDKYLSLLKDASKNKDFFLAVFVSLLVFTAFMTYVLFIGAPATKARNIHNEGVRLYDKGNYEAAEEKFEESLEIFHTEETESYLLLTEEQLNESDN